MDRTGNCKSGTLATMATLALLGCADGTATLPMAANEADISANLGRSAERCINVQAELDVPLGVWILDGDVVWGAPPFPTTLNGLDGWMASAVREQSSPGASPTVHLSLNHVFVTEEPGESMGLPAIFLGESQDYFLTDDRAVCAAGSDPTNCRVNNQLEVVDGGGIFENGSGSLHNHGTLYFIPEPGRLESQLRGRICGDGIIP
jgi:hypothetical protein